MGVGRGEGRGGGNIRTSRDNAMGFARSELFANLSGFPSLSVSHLGKYIFQTPSFHIAMLTGAWRWAVSW